jgi:siroheme synthase-like protein
MTELLPVFLNLTGRTVVLVGGGPVATSKLRPLLAAGASVRIVAPEITDEIATVVAQAIQASSHMAGGGAPLSVAQRPFIPSDLDDAWLVVAAATPEVNRHVAEVAETLRIFVNAVDDPPNASAYLGGVVRRDGVTIAISTSGAAPALTSLLREGIDALLPPDLATWVWRARVARVGWRREGVPMEARKPRLLQALNAIYDKEETVFSAVPADRGPRVPWLNAPEDSWL